MQALSSSDAPAIDASISSLFREKNLPKLSIWGVIEDDRCLASDHGTLGNSLNRWPL